MRLKQCIFALVAMLLSFSASTAFAQESEEPVKGYKIIIYNEDGTEAMTIDGEKSASEFNLATALNDAYVFGDNASLFGITGTPTYEVVFYQDLLVAETVEIPADKNVVLDLAGYKVTGDWNGSSTTNHIYALTNRGNLTIKDSSADAEGKIVSRGIYNYGKLTLESGTIDACDGNGGYAINNESGSTFIMNGGVVSASYEDGDAPGNYDATALDVPEDCTATLNGGKITSVTNFTFAISLAGELIVPETSTVEVTGAHGAISMSAGSADIDGGTFICSGVQGQTDNVVYVTGGTMDISGGTFEHTGNLVNADSGAAVVMSGANGELTISGGEFTGLNGSVSGNANTTLTGGSYGSVLDYDGWDNIKQYVPEGETVTIEGESYTNVAPASGVAKIGDTTYATLSAAFAAVTDDAQTVVVLQDVTEELTGANLRGNITTENGAKVTINLTNSDWVYCPYTFVLGENITLNVPALFYYAGGAQINGAVITDAYYQRYAGTKLTINEPGSLTVTSEMFYIRYTDNDANAGIYVNGDNNDETVGLNLSVAYFYQGMIYAKDANIKTSVYWQTNETDGQGSANLVLDNSTLNVTVNEHNFKATGNSTVTLTNGSSIVIAGAFETGSNTEVSVDATSSIIDKNGKVEFGLSGEGTAENPYLIETLKDLKFFRDDVNAGNTYAGKTVKVINNIDLNSEAWTPIATFNGVFDGNDKTISNLVVNGEGKSNQGFFGQTNNGEIKNLTINNATVKGRLNVGVVAGTPYTSKYTNIKVTGDVVVEGMAYVGGVGGKNAYANWTDITVDVNAGSYVKATSTENGTAYRTYVGGVVGFNGEGSHTFKNISSNIKVIGDVCDIGGIFGIAHYGNNFENVTFSGSVEAAEGAEEVGGIAGVWNNTAGYTVTFTNCAVADGATVMIGTEDVTEKCAIVGGAYKPSNNTAANSGSLIIDGKEAWIMVAKVGEQGYPSLAEALDAAAQAGETVTLIVDVNENVTVAGNVTIDGAGKKYTGTMTANSGLTVTVQNVNFVNGGFAKTTKSTTGNYTFKNCTFVDNGNYAYPLSFKGANNINVEGCTVNGYEFGFLYVSSGTNAVSVKNVTVENCSNYAVYFGSGVNSATFENLTVKNSNNGFIINNTATRAFTIKNCTMVDVNTAINHSKGTNAITCTALGVNDFGEAALSQYAIIKGVTVDGTNYYGSVQGMVEKAVTGQTVKLLSDIAMTEADCVAGADRKVLVDVAGKDITLNMNGKKISVVHEDPFTDDYIVAVVRVGDGAGLTVTGEGTIDVKTHDLNPDIAYMFWKRGTTGHLTIKNGTYKMNDSADSMVYTNGNEIVTIEGGTWELAAYGTRGNREPWIFNVKGAGDNHVIVKGGTFNADINRQFWSNEVLVPETYYTVANADSTAFTVKEGAKAYVNEGMLTGPYFVRKNIGYPTFVDAVAGVDKNETITLLEDVTLESVVTTETDSITIDLNEKTVTGADGAVVFNINADATIKNGTILGNKSGTTSGLIDIYANLAMDGVTLETSKINALRFKAGDCTATLDNCNITGAFKGYGSSVWAINSGTYKAASTAINDQLNGTAQISGGTFHYEITDEECAPGYSVVDNGDGTYTVKYAPVCFVDTNNNGTLDEGETVYGSLAAVFNTIKEGDVYIVLTSNTAIAEKVDTDADAKYYLNTNVAEGVTVDFAFADNWNYVQKMYVGEGVTLNAPYLLAWTDLEVHGTINTGYLYIQGGDVLVAEGGVVNATTGDATVQVKNGAKLTVNGELNTSTLNVWVGESKLIVSGDNAKVNAKWVDIWDGTPVVDVENGATLAVENIKASRGGSIEVSDATLAATGTIELGHNGESTGTLTETGNSIITGNIKLTVVGSTVKSDGGLTNVTTDLEGYGVVYENGEYKVVPLPAYVAKIGETSYTTLADAVSAAQDGDVVTLLADVETADGIVITDKNLVIDLNDKTYTTTEGASTNNRNFKIVGTSVVTIKNGTMVAAGDYSSGAYGTVRTEGSANVTLEGLKLYNYRGNGLNIKACGSSVVTINDTEIYSNYGGGIESAGGTIEIANVKVEQKGMYTAPYNSMAISVNGGGKVTVNSGTFSTECITAEEANNQGTSHGPWVAGVLNSGGTLIINGGTFSNDNFGENSLATYARGAILADTKAKVEINGGKFNVLKNVIDIQNNLGDANNNPSVVLAGGTYNADPRISASYSSNLITLADGYAALPDLNGNYVVGVKPTATVHNLGMTTVAAGDYSIWNGSFDQNTEDDGDMPLSFVMQFLADQDAEDMETSPYANWYGDFVITFTGLENGSFTADGCYLAGHYGSWGWVKVPVDGMTIEEGARYPVMLGVGLGQKYNYICSGVQDFKCALYLTPEILEANPNIQVKLELAVVDNSKGSDDAASALINNENVYSVTEYTYDAEDFVVDPNYIAELVIDDAAGENYTNDTEKTVGTLTYKRTLVNGKWNALYLPFEVELTDELLANYDFADYNQMISHDTNGDRVPDSFEMELFIYTSGTLEANYPYFVRPKNEEACSMNLVLTDATLYPANENSLVTSSVKNTFKLSGTYSAMDAAALAGKYAISIDGDWSYTSALKPYRLYLTITDNNGAVVASGASKSVRIVVRGEDGYTGVEGVENENGEDMIFDLQGRRVLKPEKGGMYIINGKKVIY